MRKEIPISLLPFVHSFSFSYQTIQKNRFFAPYKTAVDLNRTHLEWFHIERFKTIQIRSDNEINRSNDHRICGRICAQVFYCMPRTGSYVLNHLEQRSNCSNPTLQMNECPVLQYIWCIDEAVHITYPFYFCIRSHTIAKFEIESEFCQKLLSITDRNTVEMKLFICVLAITLFEAGK